MVYSTLQYREFSVYCILYTVGCVKQCLMYSWDGKVWSVGYIIVYIVFSICCIEWYVVLGLLYSTRYTSFQYLMCVTIVTTSQCTVQYNSVYSTVYNTVYSTVYSTVQCTVQCTLQNSVV